MAHRHATNAFTPARRRPSPACGPAIIAAAAGLAAAAAALADEPPLASFFGFEDKRAIVVDNAAGPFIAADFNGDGLTDLAIANDTKSRIEIHLQRDEPRTEFERSLEVNELPPSPWFDREEIPVSHAIGAMAARDLDGDGLMDLVYAGFPAEIVTLRQVSPMQFDIESRRRVRDLDADRNSFAMANVLGGPELELISTVNGKIYIYNMDASGPVGEPTVVSSDNRIFFFFIEDYDGDGRDDILGIVGESDTPLRMWLQRPAPGNPGEGTIGPELRFETPQLSEVEPFRTPGRDAASIAVIESQSRRIVLYDLKTEAIEGSRASAAGVAERDAVVEVHAFDGGPDRERSTAIGDINADGLPDLVATNTGTNSVVVHLQNESTGLASGEPFSAFKDPKTVALGQWDDDDELEVFVLSEEEKAVGIAQFNASTGRLGFPAPVSFLTDGAAPVAMTTVPLGAQSAGDWSALAVVMRDRRDHTLELHMPEGQGEPVAVKLEDVNRPPQSMIAGDFDRDGDADILLLTPGEPLVMIAKTDDGYTALYDNDMANFGLVSAAGPDNTALLDINNDGRAELLIADENFVRAAAFDAETGWTVVDQFTVPDAQASLGAISTFDHQGSPAVVAADTATDRLMLFTSSGEGEPWTISDKLRLTGLDASSLRAGTFGGAGSSTVLVLTDGSFGVVRLDGERITLDEFASYRSDDDDRREHEIEAGDVNGDGFIDLVVLDNNEKLCQVFTISAARRLLFATEFKVFEERLFQMGGRGGFEPSAMLIEDLTGDGAADILLEVHDRYLLYPQTTR
jgi:hypothetical protein